MYSATNRRRLFSDHATGVSSTRFLQHNPEAQAEKTPQGKSANTVAGDHLSDLAGDVDEAHRGPRPSRVVLDSNDDQHADTAGFSAAEHLLGTDDRRRDEPMIGGEQRPRSERVRRPPPPDNRRLTEDEINVYLAADARPNIPGIERDPERYETILRSVKTLRDGYLVSGVDLDKGMRIDQSGDARWGYECCDPFLSKRLEAQTLINWAECDDPSCETGWYHELCLKRTEVENRKSYAGALPEEKQSLRDLWVCDSCIARRVKHGFPDLVKMEKKQGESAARSSGDGVTMSSPGSSRGRFEHLHGKE